MLYIIKSGRHFKFGFSKNPPRRLREMQTGNQHKMHLVGTYPGSYKQESLIHKHLKNYRSHGEWFGGEPVEAFVDMVLEQGILATLDGAIPKPKVKSHREKVADALPGWKQELEEIKRKPPELKIEVPIRCQLGATLRRAGLLLLCIVTLLTIEWMLRKKWGLV